VHGIPPEQKICTSHSKYYTRVIFKENQKLKLSDVYIIVDSPKKMPTRLYKIRPNQGQKLLLRGLSNASGNCGSRGMMGQA
jgi:hypothetical protein